jgi:N-acetyltransferase
MTAWPPSTTLTLGNLQLEPMQLLHEAGLRAAAADGELWKLRVTSVPEPENTRAYIEAALSMHAAGNREPFVVRDLATQQLLGSTSYHDIVPALKRVEIGYTWYAKSVQRTHVNTTCKLLLMRHAFETLGCPVVGWRTDNLNYASQCAIERLGAKRDGVLRHHAPRRDGSARDTVMYSMLAADWPAAKARLEAALQAPEASRAKPALAAELVPITDLNEDAQNTLLRMSPGAMGERMVAPNGVSVAQAFLSPNSALRAVVANGKPVGLVLLFDPTLNLDNAAKEKQAQNDLYVWRLMIGFAHHGQGFGTQAMQAIEALARSRGFVSVSLSHRQGEGNAGAFYEKLGFTYTGEVDHGELKMRKSL